MAARTGGEDPAGPLIPETTPGSDEAEPAPAEDGELPPEDGEQQPPTGEVCSEPNADDEDACLAPMPVDQQELPPDLVLPGRASVDPPSWCATNGTTRGTRTKVCRIDGWKYTTRQRVNGRWVKTGETEMIFLNYSYGNSGIGRVAHQIEVYATKGWGHTLKAKIDGVGKSGASCKTESAKFPGQQLVLHKWMLGESFFDTTATAAGAKGKCGTGWTMKITNPPYTPAEIPSTFKEFRCDNATAGRPEVGCVVPWYPSKLKYSKVRTPDLARHVTLAQNSGLPKRLHRTTTQSVIDDNRDKACGDRPSVSGKSCDEYPVATSKEGLSAGGKRRTFDGCSYSDIPSGSGSKGASACAIAKADNQSQGGTNTQFYRAERVLQDDPFDVVITP
ncbi:hypothetical protein [Streptomyces sp. NPDC047071]|uniref:NucA/NucB deoxyribonuclease domain-containing protein n=1 Tax=Streptomyces sp. NPDC047071 TaxID=3154808 RepID=UPI0034515BB7